MLLNPEYQLPDPDQDLFEVVRLKKEWIVAEINGPIICFCRTKHLAQMVAEALNECWGHPDPA